MTSYFVQGFVYLFAAIIFVPLAKRLGLGSVLGYLIAGVVIGPITGLVGHETTTIQHFAEFGVVMMLFLVGLELEPRMLWNMRNKLIGLGGLQLTLTTAIIAGVAMAFDTPWTISLAIGLIFALSSTAIVLQTFNEKGLAHTEGGKNAFSVLLFQDIAVIPMLALIPLLALPELIDSTASLTNNHEQLSLVAGLPGWAYGAVILGTIVGLIIAAHYLSRPLFRYVAAAGLREIFTATALMLVIGIAALMSLVGLSPALGTFLAGVILANSEFRHELEANIEPFKGLLLGLFFITVGAGLDFNVLGNNFFTIAAIAIGVMFVKAAVLWFLAVLFKVKNSNRWLLALSLAQAGEFGFVLLSYTAQQHVLPIAYTQLLSPVVALSMFLTPLLFILFDKVVLPRYQVGSNQQPADEIDEVGSVIVAGAGRFGQIVNRLLTTNNIKTVLLDQQVSQIDMMRRIKTKSFYGDATNPQLLHTAGIEHAELFIACIDDRERTTTLVQYLKKTYPKLKILARAYDRAHGYELRSAGADIIVSETYHSALSMGEHALRELGYHEQHALQQKRHFLNAEARHKQDLYEQWRDATDDAKFNAHYTKLFLQLEESISNDMQLEFECKKSYKHSDNDNV